jgi:predicted ATP-grasp superfamily ATP-dependent carboligase
VGATSVPTWRQGRAGWTADRLDAVVTDASARQSLAAVRQLGRAGYAVGAVECTSDLPAAAFTSRWCSTYSAFDSDRRDYDRYIDDLLGLLPSTKSTVVIAAHDGTIEALRSRRTELEQHHVLALAPEAALSKAVNKIQTLAAARELGLRVPRSVTVSAADQIEAALDEVGLPLVVKPTQSWIVGPESSILRSPRGANTPAQARAQLESFLELGAETIVQEYVPGAREGISFVYSGDEFFGEFAQVAERTLPILGGISIMRASIPLPADAADDARRLVRSLGLVGYSEVEFRRDASGAPVLMEINPRLSASVEVAIRSGVDFPRLLFQWASGETLRADPGYEIGVRMRWLGGDFRWLRNTWTNQGDLGVESTGHALRSFVADFGHPTSYDYLDRSDLRPAVQAASTVVGRYARGAQRVVRRAVRKDSAETS